MSMSASLMNKFQGITLQGTVVWASFKKQAATGQHFWKRCTKMTEGTASLYSCFLPCSSIHIHPFQIYYQWTSQTSLSPFRGDETQMFLHIYPILLIRYILSFCQIKKSDIFGMAWYCHLKAHGSVIFYCSHPFLLVNDKKFSIWFVIIADIKKWRLANLFEYVSKKYILLPFSHRGLAKAPSAGDSDSSYQESEISIMDFCKLFKLFWGRILSDIRVKVTLGHHLWPFLWLSWCKWLCIWIKIYLGCSSQDKKKIFWMFYKLLSMSIVGFENFYRIVFC